MAADVPSRPGLRDVARVAGVSLASASRALAEGTSASPRLRARVRAAALELGYEPNLLAQSLSRGATGLIGFMVREIESQGVPPVLHGAEAALRKAGYALVIATAEGRADLAADYIRLLRQRQVDGFVLALVDAEHPDVRRELELLTVPCVLFDRELDWFDASCALLDQAGSTRVAAGQLLALGHRRIGYLAGRPTMRTTIEVEAALRDVLAGTHGAALVVAGGDFTEAHGDDATRRLLGRPDAPTALVAGNAQIAHGMLQAVHALGLQPGRDVSLVSTEDAPALRLYAPAIATIGWDVAAAGAAMAALLLRRLAGGGAERTVIATTFDPRDSLGPPAEPVTGP